MKEKVIEILKHNAFIMETENRDGYYMVNIDDVAESIVKLFAIPVVSNAKRTVSCLNCINYGKAIQVAKYCSKCTDFSEHKAIS